MLREEIVFGPIMSRRLGSSLGVNIMPTKGKLCNFDCIYCECGWNKDGRGDRHIPAAMDLYSALENKLTQCLRDGVPIDSITFSGDGEPTLNPDFLQMIDDTLSLRNRLFPKAVVSVLTNATRLDRDEVVDALKKVDNPVLKLDAPTNELVTLINRPVGDYSVERVIGNMKKFNGDFVLQTMFLKSPFFDTASEDVLLPWMNIVRDLRPREIMVYTIARETPQKGLLKYSVDEMKELVQPLLNEGFNIQIRG